MSEEAPSQPIFTISVVGHATDLTPKPSMAPHYPRGKAPESLQGIHGPPSLLHLTLAASCTVYCARALEHPSAGSIGLCVQNSSQDHCVHSS